MRTFGVILIVLGIAEIAFVYAHRPPEGFVDALVRLGASESWYFNPHAYVFALAIGGPLYNPRISSCCPSLRQRRSYLMVRDLPRAVRLATASACRQRGAVSAPEAGRA